MKLLIAYLSKSGNTKRVAEAIRDAIADKHDIDFLPIKDISSLDGYDLSFLGFPIHAEGPDKKTVEILGHLCVDNRKVALFITHAAPVGAPPLKGWIKKFEDAAKGAKIVGTFDCQGQLAKFVKFIMRISPGKRFREWAKMDNSQGQPDSSSLKKAAEFAKKIVG